MPTDRPPAPRSGRRAPTAPVKIPSSGPPVGKIAPYALAAAVAAGLIFLVRTPRFNAIGAFASACVACVALGYVAITSAQNLPPENRGVRILLPIVTACVVAAALIPFGYTIFPPRPRGSVTLAATGASDAVRVDGIAATVWLSVEGRFVPTATGPANYFLSVTHDTAPSERVDGTFRPHAGGPAPETHVLGSRGPGRYAVQLEQNSGSVQLPLTVRISARPFNTLLLVLIYCALAALILALDTLVWRRGIEPAIAATLLLPLIAALYFQRNPHPENLTTDLLAAGLIGALGGGLGGEMLARLVRTVVGK